VISPIFGKILGIGSKTSGTAFGPVNQMIIGNYIRNRRCVKILGSRNNTQSSCTRGIALYEMREDSVVGHR
jgi:hypothetical protein